MSRTEALHLQKSAATAGAAWTISKPGKGARDYVITTPSATISDYVQGLDAFLDLCGIACQTTRRTRR